MTNKSKLFDVFSESLGLDIGMVTEALEYNTLPKWDSTSHLALVAALEEAFDVLLDTDDIIDMNSVAKSMEILSKYGIAFS